MRLIASAVLAIQTDAHLLGKLKQSKFRQYPGAKLDVPESFSPSFDESFPPSFDESFAPSSEEPASEPPAEEKKEQKIKLRNREVHPDTRIWLNGVQQVGEGTTIQDQAVVGYCVNFHDQHDQDVSDDHRVAANYESGDNPLSKATDPTDNYQKRAFKICGGNNKVIISLRTDCQDYSNGQVTLGHCDPSIGRDDPEFCQEHDETSIRKDFDQPGLKQWQSWVVKDCNDSE